jgi:hypothetical protein
MALDNYGNNNNNGHGTMPPIHFEDLMVNDMSDSSNRNYHKPPSEYEDQVWHLGWTDGRSGQPISDNEAILRARARMLWQQKVTTAETEMGETNALVRSLETPVERLKLKAEQAFNDHSNLLHDRSENPQAYSLSLWVIYWLTAVMLLAADLPLSLKLVAMGYGVTTDNPIDGKSVDDLLKDPWYVLTEFWEAILLAIGVAIAGIFIKYLLDSLVYREEQKTRSSVFTVTLSVVLALFLVTTVLLGIFRANVQRQKNIAKLTNQVSVLEQQRLGTSDPIIDKAITDLKTLIQQEQTESAWSVRTVSFIMLTLLFPITGGICFSVGWRKLIKVLNLRRTKKASEKTEKDYEAQSLRYEQARGTLEGQTKRLARETAAYASADDYAEMLVSLYRHGYMRGLNVPETMDAGASLYERCEKAVARLLAGKMRAKYWDKRSSSTVDFN